jgi:hypothetical protein
MSEATRLLANKEAVRRYRQRHPERVKAYGERYRQSIDWNAYTREWRDRNVEAVVQRRRKAYTRDPVRHRAYFEKWQLKDLPHSKAIRLWHMAKRRADKMGLAFDLDQDDLERRLRIGVCEVTGMQFVMTVGSGRSPWSPSLDRIDFKLGYVSSNVRITVYMYNIARNNFSDEDVVKLSKAIVKKGELV